MANDIDELLTIDELERNTRQLACDQRVTTTRLGSSRSGRPIEMLSVGEGAHDALVVGVPHANEPAGAVTIERMIDMLLKSESPSLFRGFRWHFVKAIDPEGLRLNEGWLKKPRTLRNYLENFFRPALNRQPEMSFPLDAMGHRFDQSTPENLAWQKAFALTRPTLHASLHHCDFGGAFYSISRALPSLLPVLEQVIQDSGLTINGFDAGDLPIEQLSASVKRYPSVPEILARSGELGGAAAWGWSWGEMSPGFGEATYGTFTIFSEVPLWDAPELHQEGPSGMSVGDHILELRRLRAAADIVGSRHVRALTPLVQTTDDDELLCALREHVRFNQTGAADAAAKQDLNVPLSFNDYGVQHTQFALLAIRTYGLLVHLSKRILEVHSDHPLALHAMAEAQENLHREIALIEKRATLTPVPLRVLTGTQMSAIFACADALASDSGA